VVAGAVGYADPLLVRTVFRAVVKEIGEVPVAARFHDTRGTGLANVTAALDCGVRRFDASPAGIGGCPFAPGATGNIVMDDLCFMLDSMGLRTWGDVEKVVEVPKMVNVTMPYIWIDGAVGRGGLPKNYVSAATRLSA